MKYYFNERNNQMSQYELETIRTLYPNAKIVNDYDSLLKMIRKNDTVCFDNIFSLNYDNSQDQSVIIDRYMLLLKKGAKLVFTDSPGCDSDYLSIIIDTFIPQDGLFEKLLNIETDSYSMTSNAFSQKKRAKTFASSAVSGKRVGREKGSTNVTKKSFVVKDFIRNNSIAFGGTLNNEECIKQLGIARNTYYKYLKLLKEDQDGVKVQ